MPANKKQKKGLEVVALKNLKVNQRFKVISWKGRSVDPGDWETDIVLQLLSQKSIGYCRSKTTECLNFTRKPFLIDFGLLVGGGKKIGDNEYEYMYLLPASTEVEIHP